MQTCGVVKAYREQQGVHTYIRQLLALPFLPAQHIKVTFLHLKPRANSPQLQDLVDNMDRQWFRNHLFKVHDWSVFHRTIRTNNDVECNKLIWFFLIFELINLPFVVLNCHILLFNSLFHFSRLAQSSEHHNPALQRCLLHPGATAWKEAYLHGKPSCLCRRP